MMTDEVRAELEHESSDMHGQIVQFVNARIRESERHFSARHGQWNEAERLYRSFRDPDESDIETRAGSMTEGVQKIVVPQTYATIQSMLAFLVTVFTDRKPILPVEGRSGADVKAAMIHEYLLEYQMDAMEMNGTLVLIQWLLDTLIYGVGIVKNLWTVREWTEIVREMSPIMVQGLEMGMRDEVIEKDIVSYEGNDALNVSPFDFFPDPARSFGDFHLGEFVGHRMRMAHTLLQQKAKQGLYAGIEFIPETRGDADRQQGGVASGESDLPITMQMPTDTMATRTDSKTQPYKSIVEMWAFVDPTDLDIPGAKEGSRLWVFTIANAARCIRAEAANLPGRRFPFFGIEVNFNRHSPANPGIVEIIRGPQYYLSWLVNSRMANVRRTLNNETLVDPSLIEEDDVLRPNAAGIVRLSKAAWGAGMLDQAAKPFPVQDVTQSHLTDAGVMTELIEIITGQGRNQQGLPNTGRRSATETQLTSTLASGRMGLIAMLCAKQGIIPWAEMMVANNQTFFDQRLNLRVRNPYDAMVGEQVEVTPQLLQGFFRVPLLEQGIPTDKAQTANVLREILGLAMQSQAGAMLVNQINFAEVFAELLRTLGKKNVASYLNLQAIMQPPPQMQVMPDEQVARGVESGNLVPSDQFAMPPTQSVPNGGSNGTQPLV